LRFYNALMLNGEAAIKQQPTWSVARRELALDRVLVMGIVNVTPDSFADGSTRALTSSTSEASRRARVRLMCRATKKSGA
jgi:hypothetical protein